MHRRAKTLRWGASVFTIALAASFGMHALFAASIPRLSNSSAAPVVINAGVTRIVLEQNPAATPKPAPVVAAAPQRRMIVMHNIVQIARAPMPAVAAPALPADTKPRQLVAITVHPQDAA